MREIKWFLSIGLSGCRITGTTEIEDDATQEDIDDAIRDAALEQVEWGPEIS